MQLMGEYLECGPCFWPAILTSIFRILYDVIFMHLPIHGHKILAMTSWPKLNKKFHDSHDFSCIFPSSDSLFFFKDVRSISFYLYIHLCFLSSRFQNNWSLLVLSDLTIRCAVCSCQYSFVFNRTISDFRAMKVHPRLHLETTHTFASIDSLLKWFHS